MHNTFYPAISKIVSEARLIPYGKNSDPQTTVLGRYLWNIALSESLYPTLNALEVSLRNSLHNAITSFKGDAYWFEYVLVRYEQRKLQEVKQRLASTVGVPTADQIIADCSFGFWTSLFNTDYEGLIWPKLLQPVFPHAPRRIRTRNVVSRKLNKFRKLRNRISHHEPIWYWGDLHITHQEILEVIGWISPEMQQLLQLIDRFPEIHSRGVSGYEKLILGSLTTKA